MEKPKAPLALLWLRRDLRLHDHAALHKALELAERVQPVFVFDTDVLKAFPAKDDRRLSFIARTLEEMDTTLKTRGGNLLVLHGSAEKLIPKLARALEAKLVIAAEDYEPGTMARDHAVAHALEGDAQVILLKDQVIFAPTEVTREGEAYKVYTPFAKSWRAHLTPLSASPYVIHDKNRYADASAMHEAAKTHHLPIMPLQSGAQQMLAAIGYTLVDEPLWPAGGAQKRLKHFITHHAKDYGEQRNFMAVDGTSRLSPYLRFGQISVRECVAAAQEAGADKWLSELIWREFYATILFHYPESSHTEWNPKYREMLEWSHNHAHVEAWKEGKTGYPVVDAAMRQLTQGGWMHNRARMIVASFLTKHLRIDWRIGEAHFAQYLMDYDMSQNIGGWQWAASTGTDAQPYFRIFNPMMQSSKFDPEGDYIRRYVPELKHVRGAAIHVPWEHAIDYYKPIVDHASARDAALAMFKKAG